MPSARSSVRRRLLVSAGLSCVMAMAAADAVVPPDTNASGVFLNEAGDVLTARHAVSDCYTLFAVKGAQVSQATVIAASPALDLAVLRTTLKPYLSATLSRADAAPGRSVGVFAEAYAVLQRLPEGRWLQADERRTPQGGIAGVRTDVTQLVRKEQELAAANAKLALLSTTD
eukprot:gene19938-28225_t